MSNENMPGWILARWILTGWIFGGWIFEKPQSCDVCQPDGHLTHASCQASAKLARQGGLEDANEKLAGLEIFVIFSLGKQKVTYPCIGGSVVT